MFRDGSARANAAQPRWQAGAGLATIENMITQAVLLHRRTASPARQLRPIVVPASLIELHGPSTGTVTPPRRLWWSGEEDTEFDLGNRAQAAELYEAVLEAARTYQDITDHLNAELLIGLWPDLGMRRATRQAWEAAHPILAAAAASSHVA